MRWQNGFAAQSAISLKRKADKPNVPSRKMKKGVAKRKEKWNFSTLKLLQFDFEWNLFFFFFFLLVAPQYPHYPLGVRDHCHASRTFGGKTVGISMTH